ncbi:MAG: hypothetical protein ABIP74_03050 [Candidatus Saccharimonas sp.]
MSVIPLEVLERDEQVFDMAHAIVEKQLPVLGLAHGFFDDSLMRVVMPPRSRIAIDLGIRTFEVISGPEFQGVRRLDLIMRAAQIEKTGNFVIQLIEDMKDAALRLPYTSLELAEASERLVRAYIPDPTPELVHHAQAGAGIMHEVFSETYLSKIIGND